jgi:hypothetical protein
MNVRPENTHAHEPSLIEDIAPPNTSQYTDVEKKEVRQRPIGSLYQQYIRSSKAKVAALRKKKALEKQKQMVQAPVRVIEPVRPAPKIKHSVVVPPLQTLPSVAADSDLSAKSSHVKERSLFARQTESIKDFLNTFWITISGWFNAIALKIFPKRYTAHKGLVVDWQSKSVSRTKIAVPIVAGLLVLTVIAWAYAPNIRNTSTTNKQSAPDTSANPSGTSNNAASGNPNAANGSAAIGSPASPVNTTAPAASAGAVAPPSTSSNTVTPAAGGRGGGYSVQVPTPTPTPAPLNSIPPTNTVTIPQTQVQVGDKTLLQTNDLNLTIN